MVNEPEDHDDGRFSSDNMKKDTTFTRKVGGRIGDETVEVECRIEAKTAKAYLIQPTSVGPDECWIPKSQVVSVTDIGNGLFILHITEWIAGKNGLV